MRLSRFTALIFPLLSPGVIVAAHQQVPLQSPLLQQPFTLASSHDVLHRLSFPTRTRAQRAYDELSLNYDIWRSNASSIDLLLPSSPDLLSSLTKRYEISHSDILIPSISDYVKISTLSSSSSNLISSGASLVNHSESGALRKGLDSTIHDSYHPVEAIETILKSFERDFPGFAKVVIVGASSEGRKIWGVKVTNFAYNPLNEEEERSIKRGKKRPRKTPKKKHGFVIVGAQHAREWIAPAVTLYTIHDFLLSTLETDADEARELLDQIEFTFIPVLNVDGYAYTWSNDRLWRKNRQNVGADCFGIDLNRNWPFAFAKQSRLNPCSESFPGQEPFQSPELQALSAYLTSTTNNVVGFLDLHSFGQMILFPYSYSCEHVSPDQENHFEAVVGAQKALRAVHGKNFEVGSVCDVSLTAPGESLDWTYEVAKIRWSFAVELRDQGVYAFLLPPNQIRPSGEELSAAFKDLAAWVVRKEAGGRFAFGDEEE